MYTVTKQFRWEMAHRLVNGYQGKCNSLHGHSWVAYVMLGADDLDKFGFVIDFGDFKQLDRWIQELWDHAAMLKSDDPMLQSLKNFPEQRLNTVFENPTSEYIASLLYVKATELFEDKRVWVVEVRVEETCTSQATYSPV